MERCPACTTRFIPGARLCSECGLFLRPVGNYQLLQQIGKGGFGEVYRAQDQRTGQEVALKVLRQELAHQEIFARRFLREQRALIQLNSPHVVQFLDAGFLDKLGIYLVMEWLEGQTLTTYCQQFPEGRLPWEEANRLLRQLLDGLGHIHARGIIHRDLKPPNLMLVDGALKILDFGIARVEGESTLTKTETIFGSAQFMAPEQFNGQKELFGPHTDLYAVGLIFAWMLTGRFVFEGTNFQELAVQHLMHHPPPLHFLCPSLAFSPRLEALLQTALAKDPRERFADVGAFLDALDEAERESPHAPVMPSLEAEHAPTDPEGTDYSALWQRQALASGDLLHASNDPTKTEKGIPGVGVPPTATRSRRPTLAKKPHRRRRGGLLVLALGIFALLWLVPTQRWKAFFQRSTPPTAGPPPLDASTQGRPHTRRAAPPNASVAATPKDRTKAPSHTQPRPSPRRADPRSTKLQRPTVGPLTSSSGRRRSAPQPRKRRTVPTWIPKVRRPTRNAPVARRTMVPRRRRPPTRRAPTRLRPPVFSTSGNARCPVLANRPRGVVTHIRSLGFVAAGNAIRLRESAYQLAKLKRLLSVPRNERAKIIHLYLSGAPIKDSHLRYFCLLPSVKSINLSGTKITDKGLFHLRMLDELTHLYFGRNPRFTGSGLKYIAQNLGLQVLNLRDTNIVSTHLKQIQRITYLQHLDLSGTPVSDEGIRMLLPLKRLQGLSLAQTRNVTDAAVKVLSKLKSLKDLNVAGTGISRAGREALRRALPRTKIFPYH